MAHQGEAAGYYNDQNGFQQSYQAPPGPPPQQLQQQKQQQQQQYGMQDYGKNNNVEAAYGQAPPNYGQNFSPPQDNKQDFQQTFKVEGPKFNDLWAGILVCLRKAVSNADRVTDICM